MSGGKWNYQQNKLRYGPITLEELQKWVPVLGEVLQMVDWAECGDSIRENVEPKIYDMLLSKADEIWGQ